MLKNLQWFWKIALITHLPRTRYEVPRSHLAPQPLLAHWEEEDYLEAQSGYVTCSRSHIRQQSHGVKNHIFAKQLPASPLLYTACKNGLNSGCFMLDCFISLFLSTFSSFLWDEDFQRSPNYCLMISELIKLKLFLSDLLS